MKIKEYLKKNQPVVYKKLQARRKRSTFNWGMLGAIAVNFIIWFLLIKGGLALWKLITS